MSSSLKKLILVIGATGAQGTAVIDALLAPASDGNQSPYAVRALTRDPSSASAKSLTAKGVECFKGAFDNLDSVRAALQGVYGVWVNTDGFTVGETKEIYYGMRIYEIAKAVGTVRHYVWSSLDYSTKKGNYNPMYKCEHYDGKGRVADWLQAQPSIVSDDNMSWSVVTSGPYMEMLNNHMFGPLNIRADGTAVFVTPIGKGHVPMIALEDLGFWARFTFDHRAETSTKNLEVASDFVGWDYLTSTFTKVTGKPAVIINQTLDEWFENLIGVDGPVANERQMGDGSTTWRQNFSGWWSQWRDDVITRDMDRIRKVHPGTMTVEKWMRAHNYDGKQDHKLLKNSAEGKSYARPNLEKWAQY